MTEKQIDQIKVQLPLGERIHRMYRAYEGDIRVVTKTNDGNEVRYRIYFDAEHDVRIEKF